MKFSPQFYLLAILTLLFSSCKKDDSSTPLSDGKEYFPSEVGLTRIYQVDSIYWDDFSNVHDTVSYEIKEIVASEFEDLQGRTTKRIERFRRDSTDGNWYIWKVWQWNVTVTTAEVVEDNVRLLKLTFPPKLNAHWNGNTFNTGDALDYQISAFGDPDESEYLSFPSTLTVSHIDDDNFVQRQFSEERYAEGAGLYYRKDIDQMKIFGTETIKSGYDYTEKLISYTRNLPD